MIATPANLRRFHAAFFCGSLTRRMLAYGSVVYGFEIAGGGQWSGLFYLALLLPYLLFSLHAGVLIDAVSKRRVLQLTSAASPLLLALLALSEARGWFGHGPGHAGLFAFVLLVYGSAYALAYPAFIAAIPELTGRSQLERTTIVVNVLAIVSMAYAPLVVGGLRELLSWPQVFAALAGLASLSWLAIQQTQFGRSATPRARDSASFGLAGLARYLRGHATLPGLFVTAILFSLLIVGPTEVLLPLFAERVLGLRPVHAGLLIALGGTGLVVGGLAALKISGRGSLGAWLCGTGGVGALLIAAMTIAPMPLVYPLLFLSGTLGGAFSSLSIAGTQASASDEIRGRVMGLFSLIFGGLPAIGGALAGFASASAGPVATLRGAFIAVAALFVVCYLAMKSLRTRAA